MAKSARYRVPKHAVRATRTAGRQMRSRLLDAASRPVQGARPVPASRSPTLRRPPTPSRARSPTTSAPRKRCSSRRPAATCSTPAAPPRRRLPRRETPGEYTRALVDSVMHADALRIFHRGADADAATAGPRAADRAHDRAAACRGPARLRRSDQGARLALAARSGNLGAALLGARARRRAGRPRHRPCGRGARRRDAARARRAGRSRSAGAAAQAGRGSLRATIHPIRRHRHDSDPSSRPRHHERRAARRGARALVLEGDRADRARLDADIRCDRAGGVVAEPADIPARGRDHRLAPAWTCDPDARGRAWRARPRREAESVAGAVVLRLSGVRRDARLSPLSPQASRAYAAGGRSRSRAVGAVSDHAGELSAKVPARYHRADRLSAAQGAVPECARPAGMAAGTARATLLVEARPASASPTPSCSRALPSPACGGPIRCCGCCRS